MKAPLVVIAATLASSLHFCGSKDESTTSPSAVTPAAEAPSASAAAEAQIGGQLVTVGDYKVELKLFLNGYAEALVHGLTKPDGAKVVAHAHAKGDAEKGKALFYTCTGCHGIADYKNAYPTYRVPKVGGQNEQYLVAALTGYKNGERKHPTMQAQAESFSEQEIADIAAYLSSLKPAK